MKKKSTIPAVTLNKYQFFLSTLPAEQLHEWPLDKFLKERPDFKKPLLKVKH